MKLRSGLIIVNNTLIHQELEYLKAEATRHIDKLEFLPYHHPINITCRQVLEIYPTIMAEIYQSETDAILNGRQKYLETRLAIEIDQRLLSPLRKVTEKLGKLSYPAYCLHRKSHRLVKDTCSICLEEIESDTIAQSCNSKNPHYFHRSCLVQWMLQKFPEEATCPNCKGGMNRNHLLKIV
jgi:hypothetical protein